MPSLNKIILIGHLGKDPETRSMQNGKAVTNVNLATSESWKDKTSGERQEKTEWHNLVFYSPLAEIAGKYLKKGALTFVEGKLQTRKWQDTQGVERYTTEVVVNELKMLDKKAEAAPGMPRPAPSRRSGRSSASMCAARGDAARILAAAAPRPDRGGKGLAHFRGRGGFRPRKRR